MMILSTYAQKFAKLKTDKSKSRWDENTRYHAPHKPLLLLSVMDLFAEGKISSNLIELTPELGELFAIYWSKIRPMGRRRGNIAMPFWHLQSDSFWHLIPRPGYESFISTSSRIHAISKLQETIFGAKLDNELFDLLCEKEKRNALRSTLIETYFAPNVQTYLIEQGIINLQSFLYSQELLQKAKMNAQVKEAAIDTYTERAVRDQGFRRAVVKVYGHRCALCGIRILTADGHTAIAAAHIIPWSISCNDDPRNGLALCHLCHWTFDEGLVSFSDSYQVKISPQLSASPNLPGHLLTFTDRRLIGPLDDDLWPLVDSIRWHRQEKFRNR